MPRKRSSFHGRTDRWSPNSWRSIASGRPVLSPTGRFWARFRPQALTKPGTCISWTRLLAWSLSPLAATFWAKSAVPARAPASSANQNNWMSGRAGESSSRDWGHFAFQIFGADGVFERMVRVNVGKSYMSDIDAFLRAGTFGAHPARDGAAIFSDGIRKIMRTDLSLDEARVGPFVEAWAPPGTEEKSGSVADVTSGVLRGFEPPVVFDALPGGGIAFSDSSAYAIKVTGPSGEVLRVLRRPIDPEPATDRTRQAEKDRQLAQLGLSRDPSGRVPPAALALAGVFRAAHARAIEDMQFFPEVPVLHALRTTWEGNLWVQRRGEEPEVDRGPIDVLTPTGRYLGTINLRVRMPDEFGPQGLVVFIEKDEFDVPVIVVKRLPPGIR